MHNQKQNKNLVVIDDEFMHMFAKRLAQDAHGLSGRHYVSMVLRYCLPMDVFYTLGHVVDRECDTPIKPFIVHSPFVQQVDHSCEGRQALFLIFLMHRSRVNYAIDESVYT